MRLVLYVAAPLGAPDRAGLDANLARAMRWLTWLHGLEEWLLTGNGDPLRRGDQQAAPPPAPAVETAQDASPGRSDAASTDSAPAAARGTARTYPVDPRGELDAGATRSTGFARDDESGRWPPRRTR